jgi:hypothetical protein
MRVRILKLKRQGTWEDVSQKDLAIDNDKETFLVVLIMHATSAIFSLFHLILSTISHSW